MNDLNLFKIVNFVGLISKLGDKILNEKWNFPKLMILNNFFIFIILLFKIWILFIYYNNNIILIKISLNNKYKEVKT